MAGTESAIQTGRASGEEPLWPRVLSVLKSARLWLSVWVIGVLITLSWYLSAYLRFARSLGKTLQAPRVSDLEVYNAIYDRKVPRLCRSRWRRTGR